MTHSGRPSLELMAIAGLCLALTVPRFFAIYRTMAFETVPRDGYSSYLLYFVEDGEGEVMASPFGYRPLSVMVAIPFYVLAPAYRFTNLPPTDPRMLRATQALAMSSFVSILASCALIFLVSRDKMGASPTTALLAAAIAYLLFDSTAMVGIDPIAIFFVSLLVYYMYNPFLFSLFVLVSVGVNEKIPIIFFVLFLARVVTERALHPYKVQLLMSSLATAAYFSARLLIDLPGAEQQTTLSAFPGSVAAVLAITLSGRGLVLNVLPMLVGFLLFALAARGHARKPSPWFRPADVSALLALVVLSFLARVELNVGRVALYSFPICLPAAAAYLAWLLDRDRVTAQ